MKQREKKKWERIEPNPYKWWIFYFDPADHRIIIPKRNAWMGWTLNFANPVSYVIIAIIIALVVWINSVLR